MTAAKVLDVIVTLPGCAGQASDAVSVHTQIKLEDAPTLLNFSSPNECPDNGIRIPRYKWPNVWHNIEESWDSPRKEFVRTLSCRFTLERKVEKVPLQARWKAPSKWEFLFVYRQQDRFLSVHVDDIEMTGKKPNLEPFENRRNTLNLEKPSQFLDPVHLECTQREVNRTRVSSGRLREKCLSHEFLQDATEKVAWLRKSERHDGTRKTCVQRICEFANKSVERLHQVSTPCIDDHQF